jgi:hypothetical protein
MSYHRLKIRTEDKEWKEILSYDAAAEYLGFDPSKSTWSVYLSRNRKKIFLKKVKLGSLVFFYKDQLKTLRKIDRLGKTKKYNGQNELPSDIT